MNRNMTALCFVVIGAMLADVCIPAALVCLGFGVLFMKNDA